MIQSFLKNELQTVLPQLEWTIDFYTGEDNTGTVYSEGGEPPDTYDVGFRYPQYMILIRSSDWTLAEQAAQIVLKTLHKKENLPISIGTSNYMVYFITAMGEPIRLGVKNNIMEWTVNFQVTLREV